MHTELSFYLIAVISVILMGLAKGGFAGLGMTATALLASVVPPLQAVALLAPILMVQDIMTVYAYRREWDARNLKILLPGGVLGVILVVFIVLWLFGGLFGMGRMY